MSRLVLLCTIVIMTTQTAHGDPPKKTGPIVSKPIKPTKSPSLRDLAERNQAADKSQESKPERKTLDEHLARYKSARLATVSLVESAELTALFPKTAFFSLWFRQYPVAISPSEPFKTNNVFAVTGKSIVHLKSMEDLEGEVFKKIMNLLEDYIRKEWTGDKWVDQGYGFVLFARKERVLFKALMDPKYGHLYFKSAMKSYQASGKELKDYPPFKGLPEARTENLRRIRSTFTHGMALMQASHSEYYPVEKEEDLATLIHLTNEVLILGLRAKIEREKAEENTQSK